MGPRSLVRCSPTVPSGVRLRALQEAKQSSNNPFSGLEGFCRTLRKCENQGASTSFHYFRGRLLCAALYLSGGTRQTRSRGPRNLVRFFPSIPSGVSKFILFPSNPEENRERGGLAALLRRDTKDEKKQRAG